MTVEVTTEKTHAATSVGARLKLALFDLDHTLIPMDSDYEWGEFTIALGWCDATEFKRRNNEFFEQYREQRHKVFLDIKYEQEVRHKALGPSERSSDEFEEKEQSMRDELNRQFKAEMERKYSGNDGNA